ncbi:MAG TPA: DUF5667 domain-containing protein [bacterium]|nr:DUF5667 domain-containing protein [bacterium]HPL95807.1 DUF5667 domain-containing protein [bacterium]
MTERKFTQLMADLKNGIEPDKDWSNQTRDFLLSQIPETKPAWGLNLITNLIPVNLVLRPVAAFSMVLALVFISSFASVNASRNSLPGDVFYPIKLTAENLKYTLSFSHESKARVAMSMVENRVNELKTIALKDEPIKTKQEKITQTTNEIANNLKIVVNKVQELDDKQDNETKIKVSMAVKEINEKLINVKDEMQNTLASSLDEELDKQIEKLTNEIEKTSLDVLAVLKDEPVVNLEEKDGGSVTTDKATSTNTTTVISVTEKDEKQNNGTSSDDFIKQLLEETNREIKEPEFKVGIIQ